MNLEVLNKFIRVGEVTVIDHQGEAHILVLVCQKAVFALIALIRFLMFCVTRP